MFNSIILFSIKNKVIIGLATLALVLCGIFSLSRLPIDAVPDITNNQVQIITQAPNLGAQEVEQSITAPIELSMANIAHVIERRSISRAGLSIITIVFKDNVDVYWARQQVLAQLKEAEREIPSNLGAPGLAPITTGLGEIYQYVLRAEKGYEDQYSATDLRTLQDWVVRTQLSGTKGVAEVSGWGGYVKQYEVALNNDQLNSLKITIPDVFNALEKNNENTGGSYIEQKSNSYAIRGIGQVKSLSDIEKIVVKNVNGVPILIRDVAVVQMGSATRYGAVTRNGDGEVVAGIVLMLKGENFNEVIKDVKSRIAQIQKSLPKGVVIEPFIDRTELVNRSIGTVKTNLIEGALIVIFVLLLLLGNWRAGLVVASVIPLSMLFAISMMYVFGVSGNLMSLGAIDFGLIVDGAVIIVESIIFRLNKRDSLMNKSILTQDEMDQEVYSASSKIRKSAAFGELIIMIVYLPLLTLIGIEGKMFKPMAQTVIFAIAGAFILSMTYVPMMSALFLSKKTVHKESFSDKLMAKLSAMYIPLLERVLIFKRSVVAITLLIFIFSVFLFSRMGGEFIPQLDEGDLTVEISMSQGTSLSQVVESFAKAERILKRNFPEVKQIVTRIGSSEIPTDPMPVERADMMISMKPKKEWTSAKNKAEMVEKMEEALAVLPGINMEITQPMQMRFNELMTGIRQDVAVKIYGDDLEVLSLHAKKVANLIKDIEGVNEPVVEEVNGLPQIVVSYNRDKIAQFGLNIQDINTILKTGYAGEKAGVVFEEEKRFDLVLRLNKDLRADLSNIQNLAVPLSSGNSIPLSQVASIEVVNAPAQVSREDGKRRIFVGFNVRGRDVESTVKEIQTVLDQQLVLPPGYYATYGGQFENFLKAKNRLIIAVPVAMALILGLLYLTFKSLLQSLLIFTAVPMSAIGGVLALSLRNMPFSISAGVGFIALFGVAVLNGIVLIAYFNQLKNEGMASKYQRVLEGAKVRLRPVILTASVASLGFLPMALSNGPGAEVQKPLATVVIGGLLSATLLTLFVLPCLYVLFTKAVKMKNTIVMAAIGFFLVLSAQTSHAQQKTMSLDSLLSMALNANPELKAAQLKVLQEQALQKSSFDIGKTEFTMVQDPTSGGGNENAIGISQSFAWPGLYKSQREQLKQQTMLAAQSKQLLQLNLEKEIKSAYFHYVKQKKVVQVLEKQDSLYRQFVKKAEIRLHAGETSNLELISAQTKYQEIWTLLREAQAALQTYELSIRQLVNFPKAQNLIISENSDLYFLDAAVSQDVESVMESYFKQELRLAQSKIVVEQNKFKPEFTLGYNHQFLIKGFNPANIQRAYFPGTRIAGLQVGVVVPLFNGANKAKVESLKIGVQVAEATLEQAQLSFVQAYQTAYLQYQKSKDILAFYTERGLEQADNQLRIAQISYDLGEIGYVEYIQNTTLSVQTKMNYLNALNDFNQSIVQVQYLLGK